MCVLESETDPASIWRLTVNYQFIAAPFIKVTSDLKMNKKYFCHLRTVGSLTNTVVSIWFQFFLETEEIGKTKHYLAQLSNNHVFQPVHLLATQDNSKWCFWAIGLEAFIYSIQSWVLRLFGPFCSPWAWPYATFPLPPSRGTHMHHREEAKALFAQAGRPIVEKTSAKK